MTIQPVHTTDDGWKRYSAFRALDNYSQNSYWQINKYLREGHQRATTPGKRDSKDLIEALDCGFCDPMVFSLTKKPLCVYRGITNKKLATQFKFNKGKNMLGKVLCDKAFISVSWSEDIARFAVRQDLNEVYGIILNIDMPKGFRYLRGRSDDKDLVLNRSLRLKVYKVDINNYDEIQVWCKPI